VRKLTLSLVLQEVVDLGGGSVVSTDLETLVSHVEDHYRQRASMSNFPTVIAGKPDVQF
jgi:hypothetical protein